MKMASGIVTTGIVATIITITLFAQVYGQVTFEESDGLGMMTGNQDQNQNQNQTDGELTQEEIETANRVINNFTYYKDQIHLFSMGCDGLKENREDLGRCLTIMDAYSNQILELMDNYSDAINQYINTGMQMQDIYSRDPLDFFSR
jgi:hypothetical protein